MATAQKKDSSSANLKEKNSMLDLDIGKDFLNSWKSMSMAEGDGMDFDLMPASKGNKKAFDLGKADMDFNLDADFGKISSFNMDMSDLDISPPLRKDGKSNEKSKESSNGKDKGKSDGFDFDLDISPPLKKDGKSNEKSKESSIGKDKGKSDHFDFDLDISPPLKKDGKSNEKSKESSIGKDKGKSDRFAFAFDFDEFENFNFESNLTKEGSKAQGDQSNIENSSNGNDKEGSLHINPIGSESSLEGLEKPTLPKSVTKFDMNSLVGASENLESTRKNCPSNVAMDDAVTSELSASAADEVSSDKAMNALDKPTSSRELSTIQQSEELVSPEPVALEASTRMNLPSNSISENEPSGDNSAGAQEVDSGYTNVTGSDGEQVNNVISILRSTSNYEHTISENSQNLQTAAISEQNNNGEKGQAGVEEHAEHNKKTEIGQINSLVGNFLTTRAVSGMLTDRPSAVKNQEPSSEILKLPLVSRPSDVPEKETENVRKLADVAEKDIEKGRDLVTRSKFFIQSEKPECPPQRASTQKAFSSLLSSKKMGVAQPSLVDGRRDRDTIESGSEVVSKCLQHSKTLLKELPQTRSQESSKGLKISRDVCSSEGLPNGKKLNDVSTTQNKDMAETKSARTDTSMKDLDILSSSAAVPCSSMNINKKSALNSIKPATLGSIPTTVKPLVEENKLSSIECGKKAPDNPRMKLSCLKLNSTKPAIQKDIKSVGNIGQKQVLSRKTPSVIVRFPESQKQTPFRLSIKRKTIEEDDSNNLAAHPSKRLSQSPTASRNFVETAAVILDKKVPNHNNMENDSIKSTIGSCQALTSQIPHEVKIKGVEISFWIENDNNIKQAEAYNKELDDLCNMLRKKQDEAKEILVRAIVNSNKLLMLSNPPFEEKINAEERSWMKSYGRAVIFHTKVSLLAAFPSII